MTDKDLLQIILISDVGCAEHCKHSCYEKYVGMVCDYVGTECQNCSMYELDYDRLYKDYEREIVIYEKSREIR